MPEPLVVPAYQPLPEYTILPPPDQSFSFVPHEIEGESSSASKPLLDRDTILSALASSSDIQRASGWDSSSLMRRLDTSWSVENALKNCTSPTPLQRLDTDLTRQLSIGQATSCTPPMPTHLRTRSSGPNHASLTSTISDWH